MKSSVRKLSGYYPLDEENKTFEVTLRYDKAGDLSDENTDCPQGKALRISDRVTDRMAQLLDDIPDGYTAGFSFTVADDEGYSAEQILEGINDALTFRHLRYLRETVRNGFRIGLLFAVGTLLIYLLSIGKEMGWWSGENAVSTVLSYVLNTFGCVMIREGFHLTFLRRHETRLFEKKISAKIHSVCIRSADGCQVLAREDRQAIADMLALNRKKLLAKRLLLISGFSLLFIAAGIFLLHLTVFLRSWDVLVSSGASILPLVLNFLVVVLFVAMGLVALRAYAGRLRHNLLGVLLSLVMLAVLFFHVGNLFGTNGLDAQDLIVAFLCAFAEISFVVGFVFYSLHYRQISSSGKQQKKAG